MLKKMFILFIILSSFYMNSDVKAMDILNYEKDIYVYDMVNYCNNAQERALIKSIKKFVIQSNVDVVLVFSNGEVNFEDLYRQLKYNTPNFGMGLDKNGILIYMDVLTQKLYFSTMVDNYYELSNLIEFRINYIDKYQETISSIDGIIAIVDDWNDYYYFRSLNLFILIFVLSIIVTVLIVMFYKKKYMIINNIDANYYYDSAKVVFNNRIKSNVK